MGRSEKEEKGIVAKTIIKCRAHHSPQQSLNEVLPLMAGRDVNQVPVVQDGRLVGMLSRDAVVRFLEVRRGLGLEVGDK